MEYLKRIADEQLTLRLEAIWCRTNQRPEMVRENHDCGTASQKQRPLSRLGGGCRLPEPESIG